MKVKKAILTGGGRATRLHPITTTINKHLLPLANKPMIFHAIEKVVEAGITDIYINTNPGEEELQKHIGDGGHWGVNITFFEQQGGPQGLAHVVKQAENFIGKDPFVYYLSDNILLGSITDMVRDFEKGKYDCMLALSKVSDPERFGVPVFDENDVLVDVLEKPHDPPSNFAVTGIYIYGPKLFFDAYDNIKRSARGEYEISSIHSHLLSSGKKVGHTEITGWWKDTGKHEDLLIANKLLLDVRDSSAYVGSDVDKVQVGIGTTIGENVTFEGPVIIGENCTLENCHIGPSVTIGSGVEIKGGARLDHSIVLSNAYVDCDRHIHHSIIGKHARLVKKDREHPGRQFFVGDKSVIEF